MMVNSNFIFKNTKQQNIKSSCRLWNISRPNITVILCSFFLPVTSSFNNKYNTVRRVDVVINEGNVLIEDEPSRNMADAENYCETLCENHLNSPILDDMTIEPHMTSYTEGEGVPINCWNTNKVTNMYSLFSGKDSFNADISWWNTGSVTDMSVS